MINSERLSNFVNDILSHFDETQQLDILEEECAELIQAVSKCKRARAYRDLDYRRKNLIEEMAHVTVSMAVVARILNISEENILAEINKKTNKYGFEQVK